MLVGGVNRTAGEKLRYGIKCRYVNMKRRVIGDGVNGRGSDFIADPLFPAVFVLHLVSFCV